MTRRTLALVAIVALASAGCNGSSSPSPNATLGSPSRTSPGVPGTPAPSIPPGYLLPVAAGGRLIVTNGNMGVLDHAKGSQGQYAWDFSTSGDAPFTVVGVRAGTVIGVAGGSATQCNDLNTLKGGPEGGDPNCWAQANYVLVAEDGDKGRSDLYMHLAPDSVVVNVGDHICQDQPLGTDGHTGWADFTHLHFQVEPAPTVSTTPGWWWASSLPIAFADPDVTRQNGDGVPTTYGAYVSANTEQSGCATTAPPTPPIPTSAATPTPRPSSTTFQFTLDGHHPEWTATGLFVHAGDRLHFRASGEILWDPAVSEPKVGPDGATWTPSQVSNPSQFLLPNDAIAMLIGNLGGAAFPIGSDDTITVSAPGELNLAMNERWLADAWEDNSGSWQITVTAKAP